jgi:hypothetical protein
MERADKAKCEGQIRELRETVHQLTHHVRVLRTQLQLQEEQHHQLLDPLGDTFRSDGAFAEHPFFAASGSFGQSHPISSAPSASLRYSAVPGETAHAHTDTLISAQSMMAAANAHSAAAVAQQSRTVPLTPLSAKKTAPEHGALHHTVPSGSDALHSHHLQQQHAHHFSHSARSAEFLRDSRAVPVGTTRTQEAIASNLSVIRASIPPAPWEQQAQQYSY